MPAYGSKPGYSLYGNQNNDVAYLVGYKGQSWNSVVALQSDQYETVSSNSYTSIPSCFVRSNASAQASVVWRTAYASTPSSVVAVLQGAMQDVDADYQTVDTSSNTAGETRIIASPYKFHRIAFTTAPGVGAIVAVGAV